MKIISYNINGIRAAMKKGLVDYLKESKPDVVCFQELKAMAEQFDVSAFEDLGYYCHWHSAEKKGYSGVGLLSLNQPDKVVIGCGNEQFDTEGRVIRADFGDLSIYSAYFPSGTSGEARQAVKYKFLDYMNEFMKNQLEERPKTILCGDYNIANHPIDIHDPVRNKNTSGFLPEERAWLTAFFEEQMRDPFRELHPEKVKYSWWSYRARARENNKGWRIDYNAVSPELLGRVKACDMDNEAYHSDHCPVVLELK